MEYSLEERRRQIYQQIRAWNQSRLDLFAISEPNQQNLEFHGVMRFYYQDDDQRVSTKCIRVASSATTVDVIYSLIEKFRPDLRMLSRSQYGLYEVHANGEERRLNDRECPLLVQLHWGKDDLDGRFLLKKESAKTARIHDFRSESSKKQAFASGANRFSTREKKQQKVQGIGRENDAERLYHELPDSHFTRSISNPEIVMQKRRESKLQKKLDEIHSSERGPDAGGTLKIYGHTICRELPYKTLLLSVTDDAFNIVKETLVKYKLEKENPNDYCLVKVIGPSERFSNIQHEETVLNDYDCPLDILQDSPQLAGAGCITFHLRRRSDMTSSKSGFSIDDGNTRKTLPSLESLPYLVEVNPDGTRPHDAHSFTIPLNGLEIGRERNSAGDGLLHLQLTGHDILPRHCIITCHGNVVVIVPFSPDALVMVNNSRVYDRAVLEHGLMLLLGRTHFFQYHDPILEQRSMPMNSIHSSAQNASAEPWDLLPAILEYREREEDQLLSAIIPEGNIADLQFKLMPAYLTYMAARFAFNAIHVGNRAINLNLLCNKMAARIYRLIKESQNLDGTLAFWMANSSELLNFLSQDQRLNNQTLEAREQLSKCVQMAFTYLVHCLREILNQSMPALFQTARNSIETPDTVTTILSSIMSLLLTTNVNAALTIQLFSQTFHFINMWLFNRLIRERQLCTREWGRRLRYWLGHIEVWSEKQGLELAAECHLGRIIQSASLLELPKRTADDITVISSSCFKLNSLQLRRLLENYIPAPDEPGIPREFIERVVGIAQNTADENMRYEGQEVRLLEDAELHLPFLLPEDGYSCEFIKGIPKEMADYVEPLASLGICRLIVNRGPQNRQGLWTVHFSSNEPMNQPGHLQAVDSNRRSLPPVGHGMPVPEVTMISFRKMNSLGLSIVAALGEGQNLRRIFIKSVVPGGAADADGRLQAGDELLEVDGQSLVGMTQEVAAAVMSQTGQFVTLKVAKQSALYYGLATQLGHQSPGIGSSPSMPLLYGNSIAPSHMVPGMTPQVFPAGANTGDVVLRRHQGSMRHQGQLPPHGAQRIVSGSMRQNAANYPPEHLRRSQPALGQAFLGSGEGHETSAAPTGGRYSKAINPSSYDHVGPVRSKSVPDFDQVDFDGTPRIISSGGTLPRGLNPGDSMHQPGKPVNSLNHSVLYPSTRDTYSKGNYPSVGPSLAEKSSKTMNISAESFGASNANRQFGRTERPTSTVVGVPQEAHAFRPSRQAGTYSPSENASRFQPVNGQPRLHHSEGFERDPRSASLRGSGLTRYPNVTGINTVGLNNPQHRTANVGGFHNQAQPDVVHSSSGSIGHRGMAAQQGHPQYPTQRMEWEEEYSPSVPPPSNIYASVSKGTANQNMLRVGPGPVNAVKGYEESTWTTTKYPEDSKMQKINDLKEPEYAKIQPRTGPLATRSTMVSPWVREEKEMEAKRQEAEKRQLRAKEIFELEQNKNLMSEEAERLKRLKLEAEFDRRFEEVSNQEEPDDDTEITPAGRAKLIRHYQQEYELKRQLREEERLRQENEQLKQQEAKRQWQDQQQQNLEQQLLEERKWERQRQEQHLRQTEEYLSRQQELRSKHLMQLEQWYRRHHLEEDERLREEMRKRLQKNKTTMSVNRMHDPPRASVPPPRPAEPMEETYSMPRKPHQVFPSPPQPPERNSSFEVYRTGNAFIPMNSDNGLDTVGARQSSSMAKKSVSFQAESAGGVANNQFNSSGDLQQSVSSTFPTKPPQDFSRHVGAANVSKNSYYRSLEPATPFTPGTDEVFIINRGTGESNYNYQHQNSTSLSHGVVGSQESYLDPRERIAAAKLANVLTDNSYNTPERMSFRDKMKHFASEAGEETPKDRSKISRAQQRLEADLSIQ